MGPLGVTLAAILDEETGNRAPRGASIYRNYLIVRVGQGARTSLTSSSFPRLLTCMLTHPGAQRPGVRANMASRNLAAALLLDRFPATEENVI